MKKFVIFLIFLSIAFTMGCSDGPQDSQWESARESHSSLLASVMLQAS